MVTVGDARRSGCTHQCEPHSEYELDIGAFGLRVHNKLLAAIYQIYLRRPYLHKSRFLRLMKIGSP